MILMRSRKPAAWTRWPLAVAVGWLVALGVARAEGLQVSPVSLDVAAPATSTALVVSNSADKPIEVQVRVFRWTQTDEREQLTATDDVLASPPFATLAPGAQQLIRLARVRGDALRGEECYRLLVDELPTAESSDGQAVRFVLRHSVPVFFGARPTVPSLRWSAQADASQLRVRVSNSGERRLRIAALKLEEGGRTVSFGDGLLGYVHGGSTMSWVVPMPEALVKGPAFGPRATLTAQGDLGPLRAEVEVAAAAPAGAASAASAASR
jgi:fimbrial chaperone protein